MIETTLAIWSEACKAAGIRWSLYRQTLLCAAAPGSYPPGPECAQVAVFAEDVPALLEQVFPALCRHWRPAWEHYTVKECLLSFEEEGSCRLQIDIFNPVEDEAAMEQLRLQLQKMRKKPLLYKLLKRNRGERAFVRSLAQVPNAPADHYCNCLTDCSPVLLRRELFESWEELGGWPVFGGWQEYLQQVYGDFPDGLTDTVGLGLTRAEKAELAEHQQHCREALAFVEAVAREFGLRYTLLAGSVLGPVRHGGFIPWDDDIDIGIRAQELEQFEEVIARELPKRLPDGFQLVRPAAGDPYPRMFSKICFEGRCCMDLWPLVPTYTHGFGARLTRALGRLLTKAHYRKIGYKVTKFKKTAALICFFLSDRQIMALARWNERKFAGKNPTAYINLYSIYSRVKETIRVEWLDTPATGSFDGLQVPIVGCTEAYLTHLYGDYLRFPPPWKRASRHKELFFQ